MLEKKVYLINHSNLCTIMVQYGSMQVIAGQNIFIISVLQKQPEIK